MSIDDITETWHLCPNGWVRSERRPPDAVESVEFRERQRSGWADPETSHRTVWSATATDLIETLHLRHGRLPPEEPLPPPRRQAP